MLVGVLISAMVTAGYVRSLGGSGNVEHGRAMALAVFTVTGAATAAALNRLGSRAARLIFVGTVLSSVMLIQTPEMNRPLHLQALHWDDWVLVALAGLVAGGLLLIGRQRLGRDSVVRLHNSLQI